MIREGRDNARAGMHAYALDVFSYICVCPTCENMTSAYVECIVAYFAA